MFSSDKLKKLEELAGKLGKANVQLGSEWAKQVINSEANGEREDPMEPTIVKLEEAVTGEEVETAAGTYFRIRRNLKLAWPEAGETVKLYKSVFLGAGRRLEIDEKQSDLNALLHADPQAITYLDIETCGFSGTAIFLIGWCYFDGEDDMIVEQALARNYAEEAGIIAATCERLMKTHVLATYNGKRFDLPSICERAIIHRQTVPPVLAHVDLLDQTRARWKSVLPNCQLQTVERFLCKRPRTGDIHGSAIPQAYHDFVKTSDARKLKTIIHHNFLDIVTLAEMTARLLAGQEPENF
jgi:uncharacterized protein YprB with RNaseH-like and TPR domain